MNTSRTGSKSQSVVSNDKFKKFEGETTKKNIFGQSSSANKVDLGKDGGKALKSSKEKPKLDIETVNPALMTNLYKQAQRQEDILDEYGNINTRETPLYAIKSFSTDKFAWSPKRSPSVTTTEQNNVSTKKSQPSGWMPDKDVLNCQKCSKRFTLIRRRHHCRLCNKIFCSQCSKLKMAKMWNKPTTKTRICHDCEKIQEKFDQNMKGKQLIIGAKSDFFEEQRKLDNASRSRSPTLKNNTGSEYFKSSRDGSELDAEKFRPGSTRLNSGAHSPMRETVTERDKNIDDQLLDEYTKVKQKEGLHAAKELLARRSTMMVQYANLQQAEEEEHNRKLSEKRRFSKNISTTSKMGIESGKSSNEPRSQEADKADIQDHLELFLKDILQKVLTEFNIDQTKWSDLLQDFVSQAIFNVKPNSYVFKDSIDITKYIKIQLVEYKDTSKSKYINGVVINKSIAHKRMPWEIDNPKILLLSNSLGYIKDEEDFMDLEAEIKQQIPFIQIIISKIETVNPNLIFVQKDTDMKVIEALKEKKITLITNVKESVMQRLSRFTQTILCPSTHLLSDTFTLGKCKKFKYESLVQKSITKTIENITSNIIELDGCLPFLGCTILLSDKDMNELKLVKHALKKILRQSRQLILENEYYEFLNLVPVNSISRQNLHLLLDDREMDLRRSPFLHHKQIQRSFLIFKEVNYYINPEKEQKEYFENQGDEKELNQAQLNEREVQSRINMVCGSPMTKNVTFYEQDNDISLVSKLRKLAEYSMTKCQNRAECPYHTLYHTTHFFHKDGYVEMKMRLSRNKAIDGKSLNDLEKEMKASNKIKSIYVQCQCELCPAATQLTFKRTALTKQLQEMSFYCFLQQFFYNNRNLVLVNSENKSCRHPFHQSTKIIFMIDFLRIEFMYHKVDSYQIDLVYFKNMPGSQSLSQQHEQFMKKKEELISNLTGTVSFLEQCGKEITNWLVSIKHIDLLQHSSNQDLVKIITAINTYLEALEHSLKDYEEKAVEFVNKYDAPTELFLNKVHKAIVDRMSDYICIIRAIFNTVFDDFVPCIFKENKKISKKEIMQLISHQLHKKLTVVNKEMNRTYSEFVKFKHSETEIEGRNTNNDNKQLDTDDKKMSTDMKSSNDGNDQTMAEMVFHTEEINVSQIQSQMNFNFDERLKKNQYCKSLLKMSASIPYGFDLNCTNVDENDFSTIICQAQIMNEFIYGLKENKFLNIDQKMEKETLNAVGKSNNNLKKSIGQNQFQNILGISEITKTTPQKQGGDGTKPFGDYYIIKQDQNVLNNEISQKDIESELLRLDQYSFNIQFSNCKPPSTSVELTVHKDGAKRTVKVDRPVVQNQEVLQQLEGLIYPGFDENFYGWLNERIINPIWQINQIKVQQNLNAEKQTKSKPITQQDKYLVHSIVYNKIDYVIKIYFPSHFMALRKLYCGSFDEQNKSMFKSSFWSDNTGGKSKSEFFKSIDEKYVLKVISGNEIRMFNEFGLSYFEYMCRSFTQKCPSCIAKILGAYKIKLKFHDQKHRSYYVILMENLVCGINPKKPLLEKYDLKGSMLRRYVITQGKKNVTKLDTNFIEDNNSRPIIMDYTMNRLLQIAIHNDTNFLNKYNRIDYSLLVWIDHETKLIRVGIIDYIQYYSFEKILESKYKSLVAQGKVMPTIMKPITYKTRFQEKMCHYFLGILSDQHQKSYAQLVEEQMALKKKFSLVDTRQKLMSDYPRAGSYIPISPTANSVMGTFVTEATEVPNKMPGHFTTVQDTSFSMEFGQ